MRFLHKFIIFSLCLFVSLCCSAAKIEVLFSGNREYSVGQSFTISITCKDVNGNISVNDVPGCRIVSRQSGFSSEVVYSSGKTVSQQITTLNMQVVPVKSGKYSFPSIKIGGASSSPVSYTITDSGSSSSGGQNVSPGMSPSPVYQTIPGLKTDDIIIRATVNDNNPYVQQGVIYTVRLYAKNGVPVSGYPQINFPKFNNCTYEILPDKSLHDFMPALLNGEQYNVIELYSAMVFPLTTGKFIIEGSTNGVPIAGINTASITCNDVELNVKPLPDIDSHPDVNGVGQYEVESFNKGKSFHTNELGVITFTVRGDGNPMFVTLSDLESFLPEGIKLRKTDTQVDKEVTTGSVGATITFDCSIIPSETGEFVIPEIPFTFFDPETNSWYVKKTKPFTIEVKEGLQAREEDDSLVFVSDLQTVDKLGNSLDFYITQPWYWAVYILVLILMMIAVMMYRKHLALLSDKDLLKHKKAGSVARKRLKAANMAMKKNDASLFYDEMLKALWGYLSDKLTIPTSDLSRDNIKENLTDAGVSETVVADTISFIDNCEFAKYCSIENNSLASVYEQASRLLESLETEIKPKTASQDFDTYLPT